MYNILFQVPGVGKVVCTHMTANLGPHYFESKNTCEGRSFNCVTNGRPYSVAVRSTWELR